MDTTGEVRLGCQETGVMTMVPGRWGSLGPFLLLTVGIGAVSGSMLVVYETVRSLFEYGPFIELFTLGGIAGGVGAGLGLLMGVPAYFVMRVAVRRLPSNSSAVVFFFGLGFASAVVPILIFMIFGATPGTNPVEFVSGLRSEHLLGLLGLGLPSGLLTATCTFIIVRPYDEEPRHRARLKYARAGLADAPSHDPGLR